MPDHNNRAVKKRPAALKMILRILRFLLVPALCIIGLLAGLIVGYGYFGGQPVSEVFAFQTWKHLFDLIFAN